MDLRPLGMTGAAVSAYALGTMTFGAEADEAASHAMLDRYLEAGGNFVDTADVYADGASEEVGHLDEVSDPGLPPYPYGFIEESSRERADLRG